MRYRVVNRAAWRQALDRDLEVHRLTARLRAPRRFGLDLCIGRMVGADDAEPAYVGRLRLTDSSGRGYGRRSEPSRGSPRSCPLPRTSGHRDHRHRAPRHQAVPPQAKITNGLHPNRRKTCDHARHRPSRLRRRHPPHRPGTRPA
ncbi:hypothetical protein CA984_18735 [Streptosporangium minutum]|uniref:Uncharacterized protein n=1 Tax=Streptosporangium minutum TaxID=569862 RepID=A0A243RKL7_9ACTN|nr:hypothetical protein CA984_18735 [Streptosporangium minutum]